MMSAGAFQAIAHPARRKILDTLLSGKASASELAQPFHMNQPSVSQHPRVLREAGPVADRRNGRQRLYRIETEPLREVRD